MMLGLRPIGGAEALTLVAVLIGVILRIWGYADDRGLYTDERLLLGNLVNLPVFDLHTRLTRDQMAPPAFLIVERMLVRLPGDYVQAARSFSLVCGVASMFLFPFVCRRFLLPHAVPIAVGLFALSDWLIYYSSEMKQYSCDLALTLVALLLAAGPAPVGPSAPPSGASTGGSLSYRRILALGIFGAIGVWFSHPLALVLGGIGTYLLVVAALSRDRRAVLAVMGMGLAWAVSFAACFWVSHRILSTERFIWTWWDFAFLPLPPRSLADLRRDFWQIVNVFDSPSDVKTPLGMIPTAMLALALAAVGSVSLFRRWPGGLYLLTAPLAFALAASALHQYPFHGRLLLFLVPSVQMLVSQGVAALARPGGWRLALVVGVFLLWQPVSDTLFYRFIQPLSHEHYDTHGDLRPDLLDYLDRKPIPGRRKP
jgi:hypothetical protein